MAEILKPAAAGTLESSDAYVEIEPANEGIEISVESVVKGQFGACIENLVREVLREYGVKAARVSVTDRGALDCVLRSRVETAIVRGGAA